MLGLPANFKGKDAKMEHEDFSIPTIKKDDKVEIDWDEEDKKESLENPKKIIY
jgi:hypothetical protein